MSSTRVLLDTNIVSYLMRGGRFAEAYEQHTEGRLLAISFVTVGELYYGAEKRDWGDKRRKLLETTLRNFVVVPYDHDVARCYGRLVTERETQGKPIQPNDAWIAACAVRHAVPLVTHNARDFEGITSLDIITEKVE